MLFDLRGSGRRTTVKVVYLTLAVLMGGGLVLFGIGGDVSGGLVDAITERGVTADTSEGRFEDRVRDAERRTRANPQDAAAWAALARARYQWASTGDAFDPTTQQFSEDGKARLRAAAQAWERHLALEPEQPDDSVAGLMVQAYSQPALNDPEAAVRAQEVITEVRPGENTFANLAILSYQAGQTRKGDLAADEAVRMADRDQRKTLRAELKSLKEQALAQQLQDSTQTVPPADGESGNGGGAGDGDGGGGGGGGRGGGRNSGD
jgi:tetratricopeptide (TPR) repeat protein